MSGIWEDQDDKTIQIDLSLSDRTKKLGKEPLISGAEYNQRLREKYASIYQTSWTTTEAQNSNLSKLFSTSKSILSDKSYSLQSTHLEIEQLPSANTNNYSKSVITTTEFQGNLLLIAGKDKRLKIFEVPGETGENLKTSVCFKDLPITNARFCSEKVYVSGERPYFYIYDLAKEVSQRVPCIGKYTGQPLGKMKISPDSRYAVILGNNGRMFQISTQSQKLVHEFKMNSPCKDLCFIDDNIVACGGDEGDVYIWDLGMRDCVNRFSDEGTIKITCMDAKDNFLAIGSNTGVVNVYDRKSEGFEGTNPKPIKAVMNLTTSVEGLCFNHNGEMLAMFSKWKKDAVKILHMQSLTVFANWPSFRDHVKYPMACDFNATSELLTVGNDEGAALLYRLNHYTQ